MTRHMRRSRRRDAGSSTVEIAVATPLLVLVLMFVVACGRLVSIQLATDAAAHAAARVATLATTALTADAEKAAATTLADRASCSRIHTRLDTSNDAPGGTVTATVTCDVSLADLTLLGIAGAWRVTATATAPVDTYRSRP